MGLWVMTSRVSVFGQHNFGRSSGVRVIHLRFI